MPRVCVCVFSSMGWALETNDSHVVDVKDLDIEYPTGFRRPFTWNTESHLAFLWFHSALALESTELLSFFVMLHVMANDGFLHGLGSTFKAPEKKRDENFSAKDLDVRFRSRNSLCSVCSI